MLKKLLSKSSLLLLAIFAGGSLTASAADKWVKTAPADLATGDVVVIVDQTSGTAMSNDNGTSSGPSATSVTFNTDKSEISGTVAESIQWVVTKKNDTYQFSVAGSSPVEYLYTTTSNNGLRVGPTNTNSHNVCGIGQDSGKDYITINDGRDTRYVGVYNKQDWRSYTSVNNNIKDCVTTFYKKTTVTDKTPAGLSFGETTDFTCDLGKQFTAPELTKDTNGDATYMSSNEGVATVVAGTGVVTLVGVGTTTITASTLETEDYAAGSASYTLTVTANEDVAPVSPVPSQGYYVLVDDASTLSEGDQIIIAYADDNIAMGGQNNNNRAGVTITVNADGTITATEETQVITLEGQTDAWYFNVGDDAYLYASSSSSNQLKTANKATAGDAAKATIVIESDGTATINFQRNNGRNWLKYNPNNNSPLFACYANSSTTGSEPQIYRYVAGTPTNTKTVTLSEYGYKTLVASKNFTVTDATAYIVTAANTSEGVTMTPITTVPANEPVILKGEAGAEAKLTFTEDDAGDTSANLLDVSKAATNYDGDYVLAKKGTNVGFYQWAGGTLGAGRVYLPASKVTIVGGAREYLPFSFGETTGISSMNNSQFKMHNDVYNLNGQRVDSPKKGLYIVNGKKVVLK